MKLRIENRKTIEKIAKKPFLPDVAVISICDVDCSITEMIYSRIICYAFNLMTSGKIVICPQYVILK